MPRASWDFVSGMPLTVSPEAKQKTVATFLDRETAKIDALVAEQQAILLFIENRTALFDTFTTEAQRAIALL